MKKLHEIPPISAEEATPLVKALVSIIERLQEANQRQASDLQKMRDEIAVLKGEKAKPKAKAESTFSNCCMRVRLPIK